ncbi:Branched-chain amino acid transport protein (AzlD) [Ruminococcus sp. YE71]|uniref:AzlD domain-containing protein n=1 Tax=unclassified Ruminococcus TaxID=2608920 RepID=UPI000889D7AB|nr:MULTISPECIES: AzlD domain-containing protein [unclassified Ruminococcus]SDA20847.1 Branched-chain amino acid transport protein (AzlD) [Ruminococcus sp. YE78]SFW33512.1 Branched-chain amino acid transport protein (AzlD) [Ruminococcus sp. YE71]
MSIAIYILVMAGVTYLIRMLPFTFFTKKIESRFLRSFLYYVPYAVLSAMTFPAIFYATGNTVSSAVGTAAALILAFLDLPLIAVAVAASGTAFVTGLFL